MINEDKLIANLEIAKQLKEISGVKLALALKCFSTWGVFGYHQAFYLDGTTSSGPYEVNLATKPRVVRYMQAIVWVTAKTT